MIEDGSLDSAICRMAVPLGIKRVDFFSAKLHWQMCDRRKPGVAY